jgi:hypothetical protein
VLLGNGKTFQVRYWFVDSFNVVIY